MTKALFLSRLGFTGLQTNQDVPGFFRFRLTCLSGLFFAIGLLCFATSGRAETAAKASADTHKSAPSEKQAAAPKTASRQDPLDTLRDRLATRLGATSAPIRDAYASRKVVVPTNAPGEFHVPADALSASRARAAPGGGSDAHDGVKRAGAAGSSSHDSADQGHEAGHGAWGYGGAVAPERWAALSPEFSLCGRGQRQSPIDIRDGFAVELEPVVFDYQPSGFQVINTGHSLQANMGPGNRITVSGRSFELVQFHFHNPAEERVNGRSFAMSAHLVHKDADGRLAVVTVLLERGTANPVVQNVWNHLPLERGVPEAGRVELNPADLLPQNRRYFTYMGSLTTPPCTEGVQWVVMKEPVSLSQAQHDFFARLYPMNARPVQATAGRIIKQSQ